jgi:hypothetical protein
MDFDRPYATVFEMPGVRYQQDGRYFRPNGAPVDAEPPPPVRLPDASVVKVTNNGLSEDDLRRPENKRLKEQLAVYGEEWTGRKAALEFLSKGRE